MINNLKSKSKLRLSENLRLGVSAPASQGVFFKYGGVLFLVLSLFLVRNIYTSLRNAGSSSNAVATSNQLPTKVLGASDTSGGNAGSGANGAATDSVKTTTYKVQKGETIFMIAQAKQISWQIIATLNNLKAPYTIKAGQILKLPITLQNQN